MTRGAQSYFFLFYTAPIAIMHVQLCRMGTWKVQQNAIQQSHIGMSTFLVILPTIQVRYRHCVWSHEKVQDKINQYILLFWRLIANKKHATTQRGKCKFIQP